MNEKITIKLRYALFAGLLLGTFELAAAVSLVGSQTDDSVCDLGNFLENGRKLRDAGNFIRTQCKNGQVLMGSGTVSVARDDSEITRLARSFCRIADVQIKRSLNNMGGLSFEVDEVRCPIAKLPE